MAAKVIEWERFITLVHKALASGSVPDLHKIIYDISLGCDAPVDRFLQSFPPKDSCSPIVTYDYGLANVHFMTLLTPCRKCPRCLNNRRKLWSSRAKREIARASRTWMCTYTISPEWRFRFSLASGSMDYHASYRIISREMSNYFKRLRKAGYKFRYILVAESHKDGYPHLHMLLHEVSAPIPKRVLQAHWRFGFSHIKLIDRDDPKAAYYVTKYLAKDMRARVRASQKYGE